MRSWLRRRHGSEDHPALQQVDRLLVGQPDELKVSLSGLPGQLDELLGIYEGLFEQRDYDVVNVDRPLDDLWVAQIRRRSSSRSTRARGAATNPGWEE